MRTGAPPTCEPCESDRISSRVEKNRCTKTWASACLFPNKTMAASSIVHQSWQFMSVVDTFASHVPTYNSSLSWRLQGTLKYPPPNPRDKAPRRVKNVLTNAWRRVKTVLPNELFYFILGHFGFRWVQPPRLRGQMRLAKGSFVQILSPEGEGLSIGSPMYNLIDII